VYLYVFINNKEQLGYRSWYTFICSDLQQFKHQRNAQT